jgi:hypothetical protein
MSDLSDGRVLETLACDIGLRPRGAPGFHDVAEAVRTVRRNDDELVVEYEPAAAGQLAELVAAERLCCASIDWRLEGATLRVRATPAQLDAVAEVVRSP